GSLRAARRRKRWGIRRNARARSRTRNRARPKRSGRSGRTRKGQDAGRERAPTWAPDRERRFPRADARGDRAGRPRDDQYGLGAVSSGQRGRHPARRPDAFDRCKPDVVVLSAAGRRLRRRRAEVITTPPAPSAPRPMHFPKPVETTLPNGLRVVAVTQRNLPLVAAHLIVRCGATSDPQDRPGLATLTATLLTQGAGALYATEIAERVDALGARLDAAAGYDASTLSVMAMTTKFRPALELAADVVRNPSFTADDLERVKGKALSDLKLTYGSPSSLARLVATRLAFGDGLYAHPVAGTPASVAGFSRNDLVAFHRTHYAPSRSLLVIGGDIDAADALRLASDVFGAWHDPSEVAPEVGDTGSPPKARFVVVDQPAAGRTAIATAHPAVRRRADDYYAGIVATAILSGYSGRLNQEVR